MEKCLKRKLKEGFCIQFFRPRTHPKTSLQCFASEQQESKSKHCRDVLGRVLGQKNKIQNLSFTLTEARLKYPSKAPLNTILYSIFIPKVQTKRKVSQISLVRRPSSESEASEIPLLLKHDYLEDSGDKRNSLIYYNPTVPLPAFYQPPPQPPDDIGLDFEVAEAASYYNRKPHVSELQVNDYEIVLNFFHISHNRLDIIFSNCP